MTTAPKGASYIQAWLDSRKNWPKGTEFLFYTEGYTVDCPGKDFADMPEFSEWKMKHLRYRSPGWRWNVVGYAHKVFAACDAFEGCDGIGVWLDGDCETYKKIPKGYIEGLLGGAFFAHFKRPGMYTETGFWVMDCSKPEKQRFLDAWRSWYLKERYKSLPQWHDCMTLDAALRETGVSTADLSGEHGKQLHPMALVELGKYIDHRKGPRKDLGYSPENKYRRAA